MKVRRKPSARDRFRSTFERLAALKAERAGLVEAHTPRLVQRFREYTGWKGSDADITNKVARKIDSWEIELVRAPIEDELIARREELRREISWAETCLERLADEARPIPGEAATWFPYDSPIWASTYSSTGNGAHYARGLAHVRADLLALDGFEARVTDATTETAGGSWNGGRPVRLEKFQTEIRVNDALDVEIVKRCHGYSLKAWMRAVLRRGLNPRVFNAFLPYGLETKLGLDYFGRDLPSKAG